MAKKKWRDTRHRGKGGIDRGGVRGRSPRTPPRGQCRQPDMYYLAEMLNLVSFTDRKF